MLAAQAAQPPVTGHLAVERVAERVEHGRLAGTCLAVEQQQAGSAEVVEVDRDLAWERTESADLEQVWAHQTSTRRRVASSSASRRAARSPGAGSELRTWRTNEETTSRSSTLAMREA